MLLEMKPLTSIIQFAFAKNFALIGGIFQRLTIEHLALEQYTTFEAKKKQHTPLILLYD